MGNFLNRLGNTFGIVPRTVRTGISTVGDATRTALYGVLDPVEGVGQTAGKIKDAIHKSFTEGSFWKRIWKAPLSLVASPFMLAEGVGETLWHTGYNICKHTIETISNPFINLGHSLKWIGSSQPVSNFTFENIDNRGHVSPKNRLASKFA